MLCLIMHQCYNSYFVFIVKVMFLAEPLNRIASDFAGVSNKVATECIFWHASLKWTQIIQHLDVFVQHNTTKGKCIFGYCSSAFFVSFLSTYLQNLFSAFVFSIWAEKISILPRSWVTSGCTFTSWPVEGTERKQQKSQARLKERRGEKRRYT